MKNFIKSFGILLVLLFSTSLIAGLPVLDFPDLHSIVIFAPHPDDEALIASGIIQSALIRHIPVKVVVVTNGDVLGKTYGRYRQIETIKAMKVLGLSEENIIFFGYGDRLMMPIFNSDNPKQVYKSRARSTMSYASQGLGKVSYHKYWTNEEALYTRENVVADFNQILKTYNPDGIFTTSRLDKHPDHRAVQAFISESINYMIESNNSFHTKLYEAIVHAPGEFLWPYFDDEKIKMPKFLKNDSQIWTKQFISFEVPSVRVKRYAIHKYHSQLAYTPWLIDYAKLVEPFLVYSFE
jgi:LmbE family N-acetylglucosaminyl deacetylase